MKSKNESDQEARTRLSEDRTVLANERTYSAWIRTGIAALAAGMAFERFLTDTIPAWITRTMAVILIIFSVCSFLLGIWHYTHHGMKFREADIRKLPLRTLMVLTAALCGASLFALVGLFSN